MRTSLRIQIAGILGHGMLGSLFLTLRYRLNGVEHLDRFRAAGQPVIFVFWHGQMLPLVHLHRNEGSVVLVSEHADGEYITQILRRYRFGTVRGSSTRGAVKGLKGMIRAARRGRDLALTPDGPQGPRFRLKAGALMVAQVTGMPILPVATGATAAWRMSSWDRFMVPKPFSRVSVEYGAPHVIPRRASEAELRDHAAALESELNRMTERVNSRAGQRGTPEA
ncbi:MAG: lysophospholipid acyltransferase family protein [Gemmatimonadota bacterium]|nr:MAG: lysophospholipid acyltransferase family protein [Gemmatimonadota bacterium]